MTVNYSGKKFYNIGPWGQANSTGVPPDQTSQQSWRDNLQTLLELNKGISWNADKREIKVRYLSINLDGQFLEPGKPYKRERLSTVDLLIDTTCFVEK